MNFSNNFDLILWPMIEYQYITWKVQNTAKRITLLRVSSNRLSLPIIIIR